MGIQFYFPKENIETSLLLNEYVKFEYVIIAILSRSISLLLAYFP